MHAKIQLNDLPSLWASEKRSSARTVLGLPMLIVLGETRHSALLCNLSPAGAKIETAAPLVIEDKVEVHCGSICVMTTVLWCRATTFGIEFAEPIDDEQITEQILRSEAIAKWRRTRPAIGPDRPTGLLHRNSSAS